MTDFVSGSKIPDSAIPAALVPRVGSGAPANMKAMIAKALLPMPPSDLGVALAVLSVNETGDISATATKSITELPSNVVAEIVAAREASHFVLDAFARVLREDFETLRALLKNEACHDDTIRWMARTLHGEILEFISRNQRRLLREPRIIEALIANPGTPTPALAPVIETALRNNVETGRIAGFRELAVAFFGDDVRQIEGKGPLPETEDGELTEVAPIDPEAVQPIETQVLTDLLSKGHAEAAEDPDDSGLIRDPKCLDEQEREAEGDGEVKEERNNLWARIQKMGVADKVRLAVMGDATARSILIRDPKKIVSAAVMKSPRLTLKEVAGYASTKTISEDVIREIARNREWTKNYSIRLALVKNPKCPPTQALTFVRGMRITDIRRLAKARNIPAYVARAAKQSVSRKG